MKIKKKKFKHLRQITSHNITIPSMLLPLFLIFKTRRLERHVAFLVQRLNYLHKKALGTHDKLSI